jgi:hypothetical protein
MGNLRVTYNIGFQSLVSFHFEGGQNFELLKSLYSVLNRISSSHRRLSEIVNPESLVGLGHMGIGQKAEMLAMMLVLKVSDMTFELGSKVQISQDAQFCPEQNFSSLTRFQK